MHLRAHDDSEWRRSEQPLPFDVPAGTHEECVPRRGETDEARHRRTAHKREARRGRKTEQLEHPRSSHVFQRCRDRRHGAQCRILVPGNREHVGGARGRQGASIDEAEVTAAGIRDRGRRAEFVERRQ
jgi:hypothetical protein